MLEAVLVEVQVMENDVSPHDSCGGQAVQERVCLFIARSIGLMTVYAYIPTGKDLCDQSNVMCNSDAYGTSLARGSFSYQTGKWQTIWLVVILNEVGINNGIVEYVPPHFQERRMS
jgi:hypothetical protein